MRVSKMFMATQREVPADAEIPSHQLMLRAGMMKKVASGIYSFMPIGLRSYKKVENIIREEMDKAGAQELIMPAILPSEVYQASGRWDKFGPEMFRLLDRGGRQFCLGPTHEEPFTETVRDSIRSYKQLPVTLYQIQHKYRDEKRPRFGIMRCREFVMKDAYSFDADEAGLDISYQTMYKAYCSIFDRLGLDYIVVDADSGAMGGSGSQEFMVKNSVGEDGICYCDSCGYAANEEKATCQVLPSSREEAKDMTKVHTPNVKTIEELMAFMNSAPSSFAKTILYNIDGKIVGVMVRGDREINETKLANLYDATEMTLASFEDVERVTGAKVGFAGPCNLKEKIEIVIDNEVSSMNNFIVGACETDYHLMNVNIGRDFTPTHIEDVRTAVEGDACPKCGKPLSICRGVEVGHIFKLGTKYSKALNCNYLDRDGKENPMIMGCYGIGVGRTLAAVIEQNCDENGIKWPVAVAPYKAIVVPMKTNDDTIMGLANEIYETLLNDGVEVIIDDRNERPGVKFKDADLIGIPVRINVGRRAGEGIVEVNYRQSGEMVELDTLSAIEAVKNLK
ncbi:MAG: proline--tRNA ligase [Saccharofermentanaceae bacterium]|jgi:prolyl-tRNA synthetase|nr:proline--tRNA ligase [Clostridia bacterium]NLX68173.1 proline--tRNA ligase [Clostridiaceae bacterium]HOO48952.1 proline--tRNA ligase [Saccharofermentans sp.]HPJ80832.1 proline--tRNA ligase [Saccharofermentans sp.]HPQ32171.1 proline--tRNA ligase [Saccharofermentans sp.]